MTAAPVLSAVLLVVEGVGGIGLPPGRGMPRELAVAHPNGEANSWRLTPETTWRKTIDPTPVPDLTRPVPPYIVARQVADVLTGRAVFAYGPKATRKYLDRLFAAGGITSSFEIEEFNAVAIASQMTPLVYAKLPAVMNEVYFVKDVVVAAQTAMALVQHAAKNAHRADANSFVDAEI
jgi:hypothetical protein